MTFCHLQRAFLVLAVVGKNQLLFLAQMTFNDPHQANCYLRTPPTAKLDKQNISTKLVYHYSQSVLISSICEQLLTLWAIDMHSMQTQKSRGEYILFYDFPTMNTRLTVNLLRNTTKYKIWTQQHLGQSNSNYCPWTTVKMMPFDLQFILDSHFSVAFLNV